MGSSFVAFAGHGFWARDPSLELWLFLLARQIDDMPEPPDWLRSAREDWHTQATLGLIGSISASLDEHLNTPAKVRVALELAEQGLAWLRAHGPVLPAALLNSFGLGGPESCFTQDIEAEAFIPVGEAFTRLLRGELTTDARTSPVL